MALRSGVPPGGSPRARSATGFDVQQWWRHVNADAWTRLQVKKQELFAPSAQQQKAGPSNESRSKKAVAATSSGVCNSYNMGFCKGFHRPHVCRARKKPSHRVFECKTSSRAWGLGSTARPLEFGKRQHERCSWVSGLPHPPTSRLSITQMESPGTGHAVLRCVSLPPQSPCASSTPRNCVHHKL